MEHSSFERNGLTIPTAEVVAHEVLLVDSRQGVSVANPDAAA